MEPHLLARLDLLPTAVVAAKAAESLMSMLEGAVEAEQLAPVVMERLPVEHREVRLCMARRRPAAKIHQVVKADAARLTHPAISAVPSLAVVAVAGLTTATLRREVVLFGVVAVAVRVAVIVPFLQ